MNVAAEFMDEFQKLLVAEQKKNASDLVGKTVRRGRATFEIIGYDKRRKEFLVKDSLGNESTVHAKDFLSRSVEVLD